MSNILRKLFYNLCGLDNSPILNERKFVLVTNDLLFQEFKKFRIFKFFMRSAPPFLVIFLSFARQVQFTVVFKFS